jgi:hypothetical protein
MRRADDERSGAEGIGDADSNLISADAGVDDLAQRVMVVLRRVGRQESDVADRPGLDAGFMLVAAFGLGPTVRRRSEKPDHRRRRADQQSARERTPLTSLDR